MARRKRKRYVNKQKGRRERKESMEETWQGNGRGKEVEKIEKDMGNGGRGERKRAERKID